MTRPAAARTASPEPVLVRLPEAERTEAPMTTIEDAEGLERVLRRVLREELGLTPVVLADPVPANTDPTLQRALELLDVTAQRALLRAAA